MSGLLKSAVEMKVKLCLFSGDDQFHKCSGSERVQLSLVSENLAYKATCASEMGVFPLKIVSCMFTAQKTQNITDLQLPYTAVNFFGGKNPASWVALVPEPLFLVFIFLAVST